MPLGLPVPNVKVRLAAPSDRGFRAATANRVIGMVKVAGFEIVCHVSLCRRFVGSMALLFLLLVTVFSGKAVFV